MSLGATSPRWRSGIRGMRMNAKRSAVTAPMRKLCSLTGRGTSPPGPSRSGSGGCVCLGRGFMTVSFFPLMGPLARFVRLDDLLHQPVADDVPVREIDEPYPLDAVEERLDLDEAGVPAAGEVDLGHVARYHGLRVEPQPGEEHLHLFRRGVLGLVEDDEGVVERPAAHERQGRDLDVAALDQLVRLFGLDHVVERVVERTK